MWRLPVAVSLVLAAAATVAGQFRTAVDVVRVEALVADDGRPIAGLSAADFRLNDDGVEQAITVRPLAGAEIDVVVALDTSGSVSGVRLEHLRDATAALLGRLAPHDRATLIAFSHQLALGPADAAPETLRPRLAMLVAHGATSLIDAATAALVWGTGRGRPILVLVFSDGRDTASWTRPDDAFALARTSDAVVDAVVTSQRTLADPGQTTVENRRGRPVFRVSAETPAERRALAARSFLSELTAITGGQVLDGDAGGPSRPPSKTRWRSSGHATRSPTADIGPAGVARHRPARERPSRRHRARAARLPALTSTTPEVRSPVRRGPRQPCAQISPATLFSADARLPGDRGRPVGTAIARAIGRDPVAVPRRGAPLRPRDGAGGDCRAAGASPARCRRGLRGAR